jgi:hypothetical protein
MRTTIGRVILGLVMGLLAPAAAMAQETPKAEVMTGFSYLNFNTNQRGGVSTYGFNASVAGNLTRSFSVVGEVTGQYRDGNFIHFALAGPQVKYRNGGKVEPFAHALFGPAFINAEATRFSMALGGGVDVRVSDRLSFRAVQVDYMPIVSDGNALHNVRVATGLVFRFGQ